MECESHFEELVRGEQQVACPDCAATTVSRQFSSFAVHGVRKPVARRRFGPVGSPFRVQQGDGGEQALRVRVARVAEDARSKTPTRIEERVARAAEAALADQQYVSPIDVLTGLGWLAPSNVALWRQARVPDLETVVNAGLGKISTAIRAFESWAEQRGLRPSETAYLARTRDRHPLRFSRSGDPALEHVYCTHWISPGLSERRREQVIRRANRAPDLVVISPLRHDWVCSVCGGTGSFLIMEGAGSKCLACGELDHLVYLPRGDATVTRRALARSATWAIVVRFSRARRRYERVGVLVEGVVLEEAAGRAQRP